MNKSFHITMVLVLAFALSGLFVTFCTQSVENHNIGEEVVNDDEILKEFQTVGLLHNKVMAKVLDDFRNYEGDFENREDYFSFIEESLVNNLSKKDLLREMSSSKIRSLVVEELDRSQVSNKATSDNDQEYKSYLLSTAKELKKQLNPSQMNILLQVEDFIENSPTTEAMIASLEMLNNSPEVQDLDYEDRWVIYTATSIGVESAHYWSTHFENWVDVLLHNKVSNSDYQKRTDIEFLDSANWFSGRRMINADIAGGISGATGGCLGGMILGGPGGCGAGAASGGLIGAAAGSVGNAAKQILEEYNPH
ncbi:hypothetical protein QLX67_10980 [Balneolaceae bacterium ANBcel3]|nr:hypothetical protein [Balneolaceae bacterium ANBcel3]